MIYLIDDNLLGQQKKYNCDFLAGEKYKEQITTIYKLSENENIDFLKDAAAIFVHTTFPDFESDGKLNSGTNKVYERIIDILTSNSHMPFVKFSNSISDVIITYDYPFSISEINKREFYQKLEDFLINYAESGKIELRIIAYGKNYLARELEMIFDRVSEIRNHKQTLNDSDQQQLREQFVIFCKILNAENKNTDLPRKLLLEEEVMGYTVDEMQRIIRSFIRYGENIYNR